MKNKSTHSEEPFKLSIHSFAESLAPFQRAKLWYSVPGKFMLGQVLHLKKLTNKNFVITNSAY
jgi:hypothetical protein